MIVAFILPKPSPLFAYRLIGLVTGESLQWSEPACGYNSGCNQQMNVIWHHDEGVQSISLKAAFAIQHSTLPQVRDFRTPKKQWAA